MHVIGTAGHVDHGKSALVAALTGTNPDRLAEERGRGMTLDLGFAHLRFDDGIEGGIVDVPGHERFLHNMLAGAAGMEMLLLVVDAVEGVMPQTLEHLAILRFLNVRTIDVIVTKIDLIATADRERAIARIVAGLGETIARGAAVFPVSVLSGEGLEGLRSALHHQLSVLPARNERAPAYLPVDRVFSLTGLGTIVTGTLMQGVIETGETLRLEPGGREAHVRSIGVFDSKPARATAGARVALSLPNLDAGEIVRGQAVVGKELSASQHLSVRFTALPEAVALLHRRTPVRAYVGSAEVLGTLVTAQPLAAATETPAQLHLRQPVVAFGGVRFVLRRPSPMTLLGGGFVEGLEPTKEPGATEMDQSPEEAAILRALAAHGLAGGEPLAIATAANLREAATFAALHALVERGDVVRIARPRAFVAAGEANAFCARVLVHLEAAQTKEPWAMGVTSIALARALETEESLLVRVLEHFVEEGRVANRRGYYATLDYQPVLTAEQRAFFDHLVPLDEGQPFVPIPFAGVAAAVKLSHIVGSSKAFDTMLARGTLVKVGDELYRGSQIARITARVEAHLRENARMTAADFRDLLGTSRRYAVPLLEWLDAHGVTIRSGDYRTLRKRAAE